MSRVHACTWAMLLLMLAEPLLAQQERTGTRTTVPVAARWRTVRRGWSLSRDGIQGVTAWQAHTLQRGESVWLPTQGAQRFRLQGESHHLRVFAASVGSEERCLGDVPRVDETYVFEQLELGANGGELRLPPRARIQWLVVEAEQHAEFTVEVYEELTSSAAWIELAHRVVAAGDPGVAWPIDASVTSRSFPGYAVKDFWSHQQRLLPWHPDQDDLASRQLRVAFFLQQLSRVIPWNRAHVDVRPIAVPGVTEEFVSNSGERWGRYEAPTQFEIEGPCCLRVQVRSAIGKDETPFNTMQVTVGERQVEWHQFVPFDAEASAQWGDGEFLADASELRIVVPPGPQRVHCVTRPGSRLAVSVAQLLGSWRWPRAADLEIDSVHAEVAARWLEMRGQLQQAETLYRGLGTPQALWRALELALMREHRATCRMLFQELARHESLWKSESGALGCAATVDQQWALLRYAWLMHWPALGLAQSGALLRNPEAGELSWHWAEWVESRWGNRSRAWVKPAQRLVSKGGQSIPPDSGVTRPRIYPLPQPRVDALQQVTDRYRRHRSRAGGGAWQLRGGSNSPELGVCLSSTGTGFIEAISGGKADRLHLRSREQTRSVAISNYANAISVPQHLAAASVQLSTQSQLPFWVRSDAIAWQSPSPQWGVRGEFTLLDAAQPCSFSIAEAPWWGQGRLRFIVDSRDPDWDIPVELKVGGSLRRFRVVRFGSNAEVRARSRQEHPTTHAAQIPILLPPEHHALVVSMPQPHTRAQLLLSVAVATPTAPEVTAADVPLAAPRSEIDFLAAMEVRDAAGDVAGDIAGDVALEIDGGDRQPQVPQQKYDLELERFPTQQALATASVAALRVPLLLARARSGLRLRDAPSATRDCAEALRLCQRWGLPQQPEALLALAWWDAERGAWNSLRSRVTELHLLGVRSGLLTLLDAYRGCYQGEWQRARDAWINVPARLHVHPLTTGMCARIAAELGDLGVLEKLSHDPYVTQLCELVALRRTSHHSVLLPSEVVSHLSNAQAHWMQLAELEQQSGWGHRARQLRRWSAQLTQLRCAATGCIPAGWLDPWEGEEESVHAFSCEGEVLSWSVNSTRSWGWSLGPRQGVALTPTSMPMWLQLDWHTVHPVRETWGKPGRWRVDLTEASGEHAAVTYTDLLRRRGSAVVDDGRLPAVSLGTADRVEVAWTGDAPLAITCETGLGVVRARRSSYRPQGAWGIAEQARVDDSASIADRGTLSLPHRDGHLEVTELRLSVDRRRGRVDALSPQRQLELADDLLYLSSSYPSLRSEEDVLLALALCQALPESAHRDRTLTAALQLTRWQEIDLGGARVERRHDSPWVEQRFGLNEVPLPFSGRGVTLSWLQRESDASIIELRAELQRVDDSPRLRARIELSGGEYLVEDFDAGSPLSLALPQGWGGSVKIYVEGRDWPVPLRCGVMRRQHYGGAVVARLLPTAESEHFQENPSGVSIDVRGPTLLRWDYFTGEASGNALATTEYVPILKREPATCLSPADASRLRARVARLDTSMLEGWQRAGDSAVPLTLRRPGELLPVELRPGELQVGERWDADPRHLRLSTAAETREQLTTPVLYEFYSKPIIRNRFDTDVADEENSSGEFQGGSRLHLRWGKTFARITAAEILPSDQSSVHFGEARLQSYFLSEPALSARAVLRAWQQDLSGEDVASYEWRIRLRHNANSARWGTQLSAELGSWETTLSRNAGLQSLPDLYGPLFSEYRDRHRDWLQLAARLRRNHFEDLYTEFFVVGRSNDNYLIQEPDRVSYGVQLRARQQAWNCGIELKNIQRFRDRDRRHRVDELRLGVQIGADTWLAPARLLSVVAQAEHSFSQDAFTLAFGVAFRFGPRQGMAQRVIDPELIPFGSALEARYPWGTP